jgi:hypothetical protein
MRRVLVAIVVAAALAACGDPERQISAEGAAALGAQLADARAAAAAGDYARAADVLDEIDAAVDDLVSQNDISAERAAELSSAVAAARGALAPFQTTTTVTTEPPPPPDDEQEDKDHKDDEDGEERRSGHDKDKKGDR